MNGSQGGRSGLPVPNSLHGLCGRKATLNLNSKSLRAQELREWKLRWPFRTWVPWISLCGHEATLKKKLVFCVCVFFVVR